MSHVTYKIVQHDGGWAYTVDGVFSEAFATRAAAYRDDRIRDPRRQVAHRDRRRRRPSRNRCRGQAAAIVFPSPGAYFRNFLRAVAALPSRIVRRGVLFKRPSGPARWPRSGRSMMKCSRTALSAAFALTSFTAVAADYPAPKQADWIAKDFKFHTGETMPELRLNYTTIGEPTGQPVLVLHGSGGDAARMLTADFAGNLFGPGQPLDASKYYIIIPDSLGHGKSSKPSDGMKTAFPKYNYEDMVDAQYRLIKEGLGIKHLRLVIGNSMGGMHTWIWGGKYPQAMDVLVPMASQPTEMAARNWMLRRMMIETIRNDPDYNGGNYTALPRMMKYAINAYQIATGGGTLGYQTLAPTAAKADQMVD